MLLFDLKPVWSASEVYTSHPEKAIIRIEFKFNKTLPEAITCLLYLEFDNSVLVDFARNVTTDFKKRERETDRHCANTVYTARR